MAINKKEAAAHQKEIDALKLRLALSWTAPIAPDVAVPVHSYGDEKLSKGWLPCFDRVETACSNSANHGMGSVIRPNTQGPRELYSTKMLALRAVRHEMERRFASELKRIDDWIELELANPTPIPTK